MRRKVHSVAIPDTRVLIRIWVYLVGKDGHKSEVRSVTFNKDRMSTKRPVTDSLLGSVQRLVVFVWLCTKNTHPPRAGGT